MDLSHAATALQALGHEKRLALFRTLLQAGPEGLTIGDLQNYLEMAPSTLSHHLTMLVDAQLIEQEKQGRRVFCIAQFKEMETVFEFVIQRCCEGVDLNRPRQG